MKSDIEQMTEDALEVELADAGWKLIINREFKRRGELWESWLCTHPSGVYVQSENVSRYEILKDCVRQARMAHNRHCPDGVAVIDGTPYPVDTKVYQEIDRLRRRQNPDMNNAQYHAVLDRLWNVVEEDTRGDGVFEKVVNTITDLRSERDRFRRELTRLNKERIEPDDIAMMSIGALNSEMVSRGWKLKCFVDGGVRWLHSSGETMDCLDGDVRSRAQMAVRKARKRDNVTISNCDGHLPQQTRDALRAAAEALNRAAKEGLI